MKQVVDARGLTCPQPVVLTGKAIAAADQVTTIVDNAVAVENVTRLARSKGFSVEVSEKADGTYLTLRREGAAAEREGTPRNPPLPRGEQKGVQPAVSATVLFVPSDCLGRGPAELGQQLMGAFFNTLLGLDPKPPTIILMNAGVKLATEGSPVLDDLRALAEQGVDILACGTCLNYFDLTKKLAVGRISNMYDIATALLEAGRIVEL
jgi:selenium metabolism protein YedF